jgi:O-antigen ligase
MAKQQQEQFPFLFALAEKLILLCAFAAPLFLLPTLFDYSTTKGFFIIGIALLALACVGTLFLRDRSYLPRFSKLWVPIGAYFAWMVLTSIFGRDPSMSFWSTFQRGNGILSFGAMLVLAVALTAILQKKDIRSALAKAFAYSGLVIAALKYIDTLWPGALFVGGGSVMGNVLFAGGFLLFSTASAVYLATESTKALRIRWSIASLIIATCPYYFNFFRSHAGASSYLGDARAAIISLIVGAIAGTLLWLSNSPKKTWRIAGASLFVAAFLASGIATYSFFQDNSRLQKIFVDAASPTRLLYGTIALEGIAAHPITGAGWESFPLTYQEYYDPINLTVEYLGEGWVDKPHNLLLEIGAAAGLPGLALYLLMYATVLLACSIAVRKNYIDRKVGAIFFGLFLAYFMQNLFLFEVPITQYAFYTSVAWLFSYFPIIKGADIRPLISNATIRRIATAILWIASSAGIVYFAILPAKENTRLVAMKDLSVEERIDVSAKTFDISPMGSYDEFTIISKYAAGYLRILPSMSADGKTLIGKELATYLAHLQGEIAHPHAEYFKMYAAASETAQALYAYNNNAKDFGLAREYAQKAISLSPTNQIGYWDMAQLYLSAGHYDRAIRYGEIAVGLEPRVAQAQSALLQIISASGNQSLFAEKLQEAKNALPGYTYTQ